MKRSSCSNATMLWGVILILFPFFMGEAMANNIQVTNVSIASQDASNDYRMVEFDISWNNSWRTTNYENNWDAAWVFLKWRKKVATEWNHATLNTSGHSAPSGSTINTPSDGKGVFMYRSSSGIGDVSWTDAQVRWNYGTDGLADDDSVEVCVFAIEMVKVPQGNFSLGDSAITDIAGQFEDSTSSSPFKVTSEASLTLGGGSAGSLGNNNGNNQSNGDDFSDGTSKTLPGAFPKGYDAFYVMKYEITQEQYVEFLNKLTYRQQENRTSQNVNNSSGSDAFNSGYRNAIEIKVSGVQYSTPATFACNLDNDGTFNEANDGQNIACNRLNWADVAAYLDWSGLRPITELEYEKACRGYSSIMTPVEHEYAWGDTVIQRANDLANAGKPDEVATNSTANCNWKADPQVNGPMRVGSFATSGSNRHSSGGTYFGIMEMSGNLWERVITVGESEGRSFTGDHGDGALTSTGNSNTDGYADVSDWPCVSQWASGNSCALGAPLRGGAWNNTNEDRLRTSDRYLKGGTSSRKRHTGGRGGRTAP